MIRTDAGLEVTLSGLGNMLRALRDTYVHRAQSGHMYREFAGQAVEEILKLWAYVGEYSGLTEYLAEFGPPPPVDESALPPVNGPANGSPSAVSPPAAAPAG